MINKFLCLFCILFLLSCAQLYPEMNALDQMQKSKQAYKNCLQENPSETQKCDALEKAFVADLEAYRSISGAAF